MTGCSCDQPAKLRIWRAVFPKIALRGHAQIDIGRRPLGDQRVPRQR
jgi:hypothetical protein